MKKRAWISLLLSAFLGFLLSFCSCSGSSEEDLSLEERYQRAIEDAAVAEPNEISHNLTPIVESNSDLVWQSSGNGSRVLMGTWTSWTGYSQYLGNDLTLSRELWVDPVPDLQTFCTESGLAGADLVLRLEQLLGLPPSAGKTTFVEMWVSPADLFRPSADPEITDDTAGLDFPAEVSDEYKAWFNNLMATSYQVDGYPWTRLGYTYDWSGGDEEGLSEFVVRSGATVGIAGVYDTFTYCNAASE